jgi:hypothetical protein
VAKVSKRGAPQVGMVIFALGGGVGAGEDLRGPAGAMNGGPEDNGGVLWTREHRAPQRKESTASRRRDEEVSGEGDPRRWRDNTSNQ